MKVKSLFMSMLAIAALASCSQNEDVPVLAGSDAPEAKVILKLMGDGVNNTRAVGDSEAATENGAGVKDVTVFFFGSSGVIVGKPQFVKRAGLESPLTTTTDASQIAVIANIGGEAVDAMFDGVNSLDQLKAVKVSSIKGSAVVQTKANLYMSGMGAIVDGESEGQKNATVALHFLTSRIKNVTIDFKDSPSKDKYGNVTGESDVNHFKIKRVYLTTAQISSRLLPSEATSSVWPILPSWISDGYAWAGAVTQGQWETDAWSGGLPTGGCSTVTGYEADNADLIPVSYVIKALKDNSTTIVGEPWYVFQNPASSGFKTGVVIEYDWKSTSAEGAGPVLTRYFTAYFGETGISPLETGKTYDIKLNLKGNFTPGGDGGGGTDTPGKPTESTTVTVTVTPAAWTTADVINKDFGSPVVR